MASILRNVRKIRKQIQKEPVLESSIEIKPTAEIQKCSTKFSHGNFVTIKKGYYKGYKGYVKEFYPVKYIVKIPEKTLEQTFEGLTISESPQKMITIALISKQIKKMDINGESKIQVVSGKYASPNKFYDYEMMSPKIDIVLSNDNIITEDINNVFYHDLVLNIEDTKCLAQVIRINEDCTFDAFVKIGSYSKRMNNLTRDKIIEIEEGFKSKALANVEIEQEQVEEEISFVESEDQLEEEEPEEERVYEYIEEEPEMKTSFKQIESASIMETQLSKEEKMYKDEISKIIKLFKIPVDYIDIYAILPIVKDIVKKVSYEKTITNTPDIKYILAGIVFNEIIKIGYRMHYQNFGFSFFVDRLIEKKYFRETDISFLNESILLKLKTLENILGWKKSDFDEMNKNIQSLLDNEKHNDILKLLMKNAWSIDKKLLMSEIKEEPENSKRMWTPEDLILVGTREMKKYDILNMISVDDLIEGKELPEKEKTILWGKPSEEIIKSFKLELEKLMEKDTKSESDYKFIIDNINRAPFAIRDLKTQNKNTDYFTFIYNDLLSKIKTLREKLKLNKELLQKTIELKKEQRQQIREKALKKRYRGEEEEEEDYVAKNTKAYEQERKRREMKKIITKGARLRLKSEPVTETETESEHMEIEEEPTESTTESTIWSEVWNPKARSERMEID